MKKRSKPVYVARAANVRVPVYRYAARDLPAGKKVPVRYCVAYRKAEGEPAKRETFSVRKQAEGRADEMALAIANGQAEVLELTNADRESWLLSVRMAAKLGMRPHMAIEELSAIKEALGSVPPMEAVNFYRRGIASVPAPKISAREVLDRLNLSLGERPAQTPGEYQYRQAIRNDLKKFAEAHPRLECIVAQQIRQYLSELRMKNGERIGSRRRDNIRDEIVTLFRFAKTRDGGEVLSPVQTTEAELVKRLKDPTEITLYSPEELTLLLKFVSPRWLPWMVIAAFAGLRPTEILRLKWNAFKWAEKPNPCIAVPAQTARKTKLPRRAELLPILAHWLSEYRGAVGHIYGAVSLKTERKLLDALADETARLGGVMSKALGAPWKWQPDALRHGYGSYRYAQVKDFAVLASWMGNSVQTIKKRYFDSKAEEEADAYLSIRPEQAANVIQGHFALA